ncbi:MAG: valine--tRNA ligase [Deltaproteobacteria bacterium]|nr:valine--tRNA ligase [Deltaproteobacteria bacterium]
MNQIASQYDPRAVEEGKYAFWESSGFFSPTDHPDRKNFSIVIPPPNVTGVLHMGHALNNTLQDVLVRWRRMAGDNVLWVPGTDHAGIATQVVVERELAREGLTKEALGREKFLERVWQWRRESGDTILVQLKSLGCSCAWDYLCFTMDEKLSRAVLETFIQLYEEGLIYRDKYLVNWCPRCQTALSDLESPGKETAGAFYTIRYPLEEDGHLDIATTRPETMLGDTAVAVHPEDERYRHLVGRRAVLPLVGRKLPIIAEAYVDPTFGTGCLKVTPAHDLNDYRIGLRHGLEQVNILTPDGRINENGLQFAGLTVEEGRKKVVEELKEKGHLIKIEPYRHSVPHCFRCGTMAEPYLSTQWFVRTKQLAEPAIKAVREGRTRIVPKQYENWYLDWMENIMDWCISRQIWWGHRIPAWYCQACDELHVGRRAPTACAKCGDSEFREETDVLDTWYSSALWPFSTMGWPDRTAELERFYPTGVLATAFDIINFWVARMMMMGLHFMKDVPFHDVYIHGLIRDAMRRKISKTLGNVIDPVDLMEKYGTDALRFTLTALCVQGRDIALRDEVLEGYKHFMNKIWNASRLVLSNMEGLDLSGPDIDKGELSLEDTWILGRLSELTSSTQKALEEFRFNDYALDLYHFFWHEYCDWYLEAKKLDFYSSDAARKRRGSLLAGYVLEILLRLLHPAIPFITEEIWQRLTQGRSGASIMVAPWPEAPSRPVVQEEIGGFEFIKEIISAVRNMKSELGIPVARKGTLVLRGGEDGLLERVRKNEPLVLQLAQMNAIQYSERQVSGVYAGSMVQGVEIIMLLEGLMDVEAERERLNRELQKMSRDKVKFMEKLKNPQFLERAPEEVIQKTRSALQQFEEKENHLQKSYQRISALMDTKE